MFRLQTVGGFGGKSDQLNAYNVFMGDPSYFEHDLRRYYDVTPRSLQTVISQYLGTGAPANAVHHVTLSVVPRGQRELAVRDSVAITVS